jgi:hypothetical protein
MDEEGIRLVPASRSRCTRAWVRMVSRSRKRRSAGRHQGCDLAQQLVAAAIRRTCATVYSLVRLITVSASSCGDRLSLGQRQLASLTKICSSA